MMNHFTNKQLGALGERYAAAYLKEHKCKILEKNYKCKLGEIDLIVRNGEEVAFIEVKTRQAHPYVRGMYAVDRQKQEHILRTAAYYLAESKCRLQPRMDVMEVELDPDGKLVSVNHIKAAFFQSGDYARY